MKLIDLSLFFEQRARLNDLEKYNQQAVEFAGEGSEVVLMGLRRGGCISWYCPCPAWQGEAAGVPFTGDRGCGDF